MPTNKDQQQDARLTALETRVSDLENWKQAVDPWRGDIENRVKTLEAATASLDARVDVLEGAAPPADTIAPAVPMGLTATVISSSQINLAWQPSTDTGGSGLAGYWVYRGTTKVATVTGTSHNSMGLTPSTTYTYTVRAIDVAGNLSAASTPVTATTLASTTPPPSGAVLSLQVIGDPASPTTYNILATALDPAVVAVEWGVDGSYSHTNKNPAPGSNPKTFDFRDTYDTEYGPQTPPQTTGYHTFGASPRSSDGSHTGPDESILVWVGPNAPPPQPTPPPLPAMFPADAIWNVPIDTALVHAQSAQWLTVQGSQAQNGLHPDFGTTLAGSGVLRYNGIPINVVPGASTPKKVVQITTYASESDPMPAAGIPIPTALRIENDPVNPADPPDPNSDRHCLIVDTDAKRVHELYQMDRLAGGAFRAVQYSTWDYQGYALRPDGWTSADAAGLPMANLMVNYDEVAAAMQANSVVPHAFRFTTGFSYNGPAPQYVWPARHYTTSGDSSRMKFGLRVRLKASVNISGFSPMNQAILRTLKKYGMFFADNGGPWFLSGSPDSRWNDNDLHALQSLIAADNFEVVDESTWMVNPNSAQAQPK